MDKILIWIFDTFKAKNPRIAALILALLGGVYYFLQNGGADYFGDASTKILEIVTLVWLALQGASTPKTK